MLKPLIACCAALFATLTPLLLSGCAADPGIPSGRNFESLQTEPSSPDSTFGVSGNKDSSNSYLSTLQILWPEGTCSGTLIAPRVALTSAHCFCLPPDFGAQNKVYDISDCMKNAPTEVDVLTSYYLETGKGRGDIFITGKGTLTVHEDFRSEIKNGAIQSHRADIALVRLKAPLMFEINGSKRFIEPDGRLPDQDVSLGELLTVVGYGPYAYGERKAGVRRFGTNTVTDLDYSSRPIPASTNGVADRRITQGKREFRFRASGAHTRVGDSGGPCFRTDGSKRWLVGVNGGHANQGNESWFTSTFPYKDWIEAQLTRLETR